MLARLTGSLMGLSWWTTYVLTPFRLDGLALGAFLAVTAREQGGWIGWLGLCPRWWPWSVDYWHSPSPGPAWSREELEVVLPIRAALILTLLACLLVSALIAPEQSATSRLFRSRFLGTYSYGHLVLSDHEPHRIRICPLARLSRDGGGAAGYRGRLDLACPGLSELRALFEKRFLRLKRLFATAEEPAPQPAAGAARPDTRWRPISDAKCH
jgi:hypothetical protein